MEFAILAPAFLFLLFVIAETSMIFIAEEVMDDAVFESARLVRTGQVQKANLSESEFRAQVCEKMSVFIDCADGSSDFYLDVRSFDTFQEMTAAMQAKPVDEQENFSDEGEYEFGNQGDIVVVRAYYQWPTNRIFGNMWLKNMNNGKRLIGSFTAFRNEPFGSAG